MQWPVARDYFSQVGCASPKSVTETMWQWSALTAIKTRRICVRRRCISVENYHSRCETMELIYELWQYGDTYDYWLVLLAALKEPYVFIFRRDARITNKFSALCVAKTQRGHFEVLMHITGLLYYVLCHYSKILAWISEMNEYKAISWQAHP